MRVAAARSAAAPRRGECGGEGGDARGRAAGRGRRRGRDGPGAARLRGCLPFVAGGTCVPAERSVFWGGGGPGRAHPLRGARRVLSVAVPRAAGGHRPGTASAGRLAPFLPPRPPQERGRGGRREAGWRRRSFPYTCGSDSRAVGWGSPPSPGGRRRGPAAAGAPGAPGGGGGAASGGAGSGITCDSLLAACSAAIFLRVVFFCFGFFFFPFSSFSFSVLPPPFSGRETVRKCALRCGKIRRASATPSHSFVLCFHIMLFNKRLRANMFRAPWLPKGFRKSAGILY